MMDVTQDKLISGEYVFHISNTSTTKLTVTGVSSSNPLHKKFAISPDSRSIEPGEMLSVIVGWMYPTPDFPTPPGTITLMTEERGEISRAIPLQTIRFTLIFIQILRLPRHEREKSRPKLLTASINFGGQPYYYWHDKLPSNAVQI